MSDTVSIRRAPRIRKVLGAAAILGVAAFLAYGLHVTVGLPGGRALYSHGLYGAMFALVAGVLTLRVALVPRERYAWFVFAVATCAHLCGWLSYWLFVEGSTPIPYPSVADAWWLVAYVLDYYALALLLRARAERFRRALLVDGAIGILALAAISAAVVFDQLSHSTGASTSAILTNLAYPLADLVLTATVVTVFALSGWRPGRCWGLIGLAFAIQAVADSTYLYQTAAGTLVESGVLDMAWPLAGLLIALAAWTAPRGGDEIELEGWRMLVVPGVFTLAAVGVLVYGSLAGVAPVATLLATATLGVATVRTVIAFRRMLQLAEQHERALDAAFRDHLTGLRNHRAFHEALEEVLSLARDSETPVCLLMLDMVGLKATNDTLGHQAGDERLKGFSARLMGVLRGGDVAYRVGGDEFAVILPGVQAWTGFNVAGRLQLALSGDQPGAVPKVSIGVAEAEAKLDKDTLIGRADSALVEAKRSHRRIVLYSEGLDLERDRGEANGDALRVHTKTLATALARAVDAKDSYTRSHSETVAEMCVTIAAGLGFGPGRTQKLRLAGLLHDVGKIGIPDTILQKPSRLTDEEFETMKMHSQLGYSIVSGAGLEQEAHWILHHHERPDGRGYPDGLVGEEIPLESRVILVADAFEAMTSDRPYRRGRPEAEALEELRRQAGTQFDADCVAALEQALQRGADVASRVEEWRGHDAEEERGGAEQNGDREHLGLGSRVGLG